MSWETDVDELERRRALVQAMGGAEGIARQRKRGKLTVRERIDLLADPDSFREFLSLTGTGEYEDNRLVSFTPKGFVAGTAKIDGRKVILNGGDFTVRGGSGSGTGSGSVAGSGSGSGSGTGSATGSGSGSGSDEKLTITPKPCGSGGRLVNDGGYDPPCNFLKIKRPQPMTFNREDFPAYCAHCYFQNISPIEPGGKPLFETLPSDDLGKTPCKIYIYK